MRSHLTIGLMLMVLTACGGGGGGAQTEALPGKQATFTVSGNVTGLGAAGIVLVLANLDNNQSETVTVTGDNLAGPRSFSFALGIASGSRYAVSVRTPPVGLGCTVANGSGTIASANVGNVTITCAPNTFTVGGSVTGLAGSGLVLRNNGGDSRSVSSNGLFTFDTALSTGASYAVTVQSQPSSPSQNCVVGNGTGTSTGGNVTNVTITCTTNTYSVGGTVSGLVGSGLVLRINGGGDLPWSSNAAYSFAGIASGTAYTVAVATQPSAPNQTCAVANSTGILTNGNVTNVAISCTTNQYTIAGNVSGLAGSGLVLHNNGISNATFNGSSFNFPTQISGTTYNVSIFSQPVNPEQICSIANNTGTVSGHVTNITLNCVTVPTMTVQTSNPTSNAINVARTINPTVNFSVPLNGATVTTSNVTFASGAGNQSIGTSVASNQITVLPSTKLLPLTTYSLNVGNSVRGSNNDRLVDPFTLSFTTADGQWQGRTPVETETASISTAQVAMNTSGVAFAVWPQHDGTTVSVWASRYLPASGVWSAATLIENDNSGSASSARVAVDAGGNAIVTWLLFDGTRYNLMANRFNAANGTWSMTPVRLESNFAGNIMQYSLASSGNDHAVVAWTRFESGFGFTVYDLSTSRYSFSANTWSAAAQLVPGGGLGTVDLNVSVATNAAGDATAVWLRNDDAVASRYSVTTGTWSSLIPIESINPGAAQAPRVAMDAAGNAVAVWYQYDGTQTNVYANRYAVASGTWGSATVLETDNAGTAITPQVTMDSLGNAIAIWQQIFTNGRFDVVANRYSIGSNSWGTAGLIETANVGDAGNAQIAIDAIGNALAVWNYFDGTQFSVMANRYSARSGTWGTATLIETDNAGQASAPNIFVDATGSGIAFWTQSDGTRYNVYSNRFE